MTDPAPNSSDRLALLYHLSQTFNSSLDLEEVLNRVMDEVIRAVRAERGFVMLKSLSFDSDAALEASGEEKLSFAVARGMDQKTIDAPQFQISRSTVERVAREGTPILTSDAQTDERFNLRQSVMNLGLRSILCVPSKLKGRVLGVIYVDNRLQAGIFTQADLDLLSAIASSAAIAIENARLYRVAVEKGRMEQEMRLARKVQSSLLPRAIPQLAGWQFAALWKPARQVGGDYYDIIPCAAEGNDDATQPSLALVIADVTDKGMPAALFMASTRSMVRASTYHSISPVDVITRTNRLICEEGDDGLFVTLFYAHIHPHQDSLTYVNAGHNPPLLYKAAHKRMIKLAATGLPLGVEEDAVYRQKTIVLESGDFLLLYTDGITDALNAQEEDFSLERLEQVVLSGCQLPASQLLAAVERAVDDFADAGTPFDDLTAMVIRRS